MASNTRFGEEKKPQTIPNFEDVGASQGNVSGEASGTQIMGLQGGFGTSKESKRFAGVNEANMFSSSACVLSCFPISFTHGHVYVPLIVRLTKQVTTIRF